MTTPIDQREHAVRGQTEWVTGEACLSNEFAHGGQAAATTIFVEEGPVTEPFFLPLLLWSEEPAGDETVEAMTKTSD